MATLAISMFVTIAVITNGIFGKNVTQPQLADFSTSTTHFKPTKETVNDYFYTAVASDEQTNHSNATAAPVMADCYYSKANYGGHLDVGCKSPWQGYLQTRGKIKTTMDEWMTVAVPEAHKVSISFSYLVFTDTAEPKLLPDGKWDCSTPDWRHFRYHFPCNLLVDCTGGEDEADCPYTGRCGQGKLTISDRCYMYVHQSTIEWIDAETMCRQHGGYLASLNTPREWNDVSKVLQDSVFTFTAVTEIQVGFSKAPANLGHMYKYEFLWSDTTVDFYNNYEYGGTASFGSVKRTFPNTKLGLFVVQEFIQFKTTSHLCELQESPEENLFMQNRTRSSTIRLAVSTNQNQSLDTPHVVCPDGHVTHMLLACDAQSACWAREAIGNDIRWGVPSYASCPAPITSRPPMFSCRSGVQHVPYSLVCDHRQDCNDASDEDFCDFEQCGGDTPIQCGASKQCLRGAVCDGDPQCVDGSDEDSCDSILPLSREDV
ncbi:hypothetical protein BaRGS_00039870, partial [Batillaria attramentaria]